mgnify:CR=1 FL=1
MKNLTSRDSKALFLPGFVLCCGEEGPGVLALWHDAEHLGRGVHRLGVLLLLQKQLAQLSDNAVD